MATAGTAGPSRECRNPRPPPTRYALGIRIGNTVGGAISFRQQVQALVRHADRAGFGRCGIGRCQPLPGDTKGGTVRVLGDAAKSVPAKSGCLTELGERAHSSPTGRPSGPLLQRVRGSDY
jgi:hypothetical protein